jgi:serine/threonine-protein kinase
VNELRILGDLDLRGTDGNRVDSIVAQPKRLALLAYLTLATPGGAQQRDLLISVFWPELDESNARNSLNQSLHRLRIALGPETVASRGTNEVGIDPTQLSCDALDFLEAVEDGELERALKLYRGDLLKALFVSDSPEFERWLDSERAMLRRKAFDAAITLGRGAEDVDDLASAARWHRRALSIMPERETAARRLMTVLARAGDAAGAVQVFDRFAARLAEDYGLQPSDEARAIIESIRRPLASEASLVPEAAEEDRQALAAELTDTLASLDVNGEAVGRRSWSRIVSFVAIAAVFLAVGAASYRWFIGSDEVIETDSLRVTVLPLVSALGGDTALENLGHAVAARISADLDGIGAIRTADYATTRTNGQATSTLPEHAAEWARAETGADRVIQGSLARVGADEVGVELALYDSDRTLLARASFAGAQGDAWALADTLAWRLLDQIWSAGGDDSREYYHRILLRGRPFTAVREYLLADRLFWGWERGGREGEGNREIADAYERAWRADTTLWMASYMNHWVTGPGQYVDPGPRDTVVVDAWRDHVEDLPPAYQLWIEAWGLPFQSEASLRRLQEMLGPSAASLRSLQEVLGPSATIPRGLFGPIQYKLADHLHRGGRAYGYSAEYTADMMEAAVEAGFGAKLYDPDHLLLTALGRDEAATQLWFDWWLARGGDESDPDLYRFYRLVTGHLAGQPDSILADSVAAQWDLDLLERLDELRISGVPDLAIDLMGRISSSEADPEQTADLRLQKALAWADRGAWDSVMVELREILELKCKYCELNPYWYAAVGEWLGALAPGSADGFRPSAVSRLQQWGDECFDCVIWLASVDGLVAFARRDPYLLRDALHRVESVPFDARLEQIAAYVARSLRAADLELSGDRREAGDSLYALVRDSQYPPRVDGDGYGHTEAFNRLSAARWLRGAGDWPKARSVVTELQRPWFAARHWDDNELVLIVSGLGYLELARIAEIGGSATMARDYYEQFLRRYDMPVEAHRPMVEEARAAYERLGGEMQP